MAPPPDDNFQNDRDSRDRGYEMLSKLMELNVQFAKTHTLVEGVIENQKRMEAGIVDVGARVRVLENTLNDRAVSSAMIVSLQAENKENTDFRNRADASFKTMAKMGVIVATLASMVTGAITLLFKI